MQTIYKLLLAAAAITPMSAVAGTVVPAQRGNFNLSEQVANKARKAASKSVANKITEADLEGQSIITEAPEGTLKHYSGSSSSVSNVFGVSESNVDGVIADITFTEDGKAYWLNPLSNAPFGSYIVGDVNADNTTITFNFPQYIYMEDYEWMVYNFYAACFESTTEDGTTSYSVSDTQTVTFNINEDGTITQQGDLYIGVGDYDVWDEYFYFDGYADKNIVLTPFSATAVTAPEGLKFEDWVIEEKYNDNPKWLMQVAIDGEDVYFKGFNQEFPEWTFKGTITTCNSDSENFTKVVVPSAQYVGNAYYRYNYTMAGVVKYEFSEAYNREIGVVTPTGTSFVFDYNEADHILTSPTTDDVLLINEGNKDVSPNTVAVDPTIYRQGEISDYTPAAPSVLKYEDLWENYSQIGLRFTAPCQTVEAQLLRPEYCSYEVYVDGEVFTFSTEDYPKIDKDYTEVPYTYTDEYDIQYQVGNDYHYVYFYFNTMESLGVRLIYTNPADGKKYYSDITSLDVTGVEGISADLSPVVSTQYFDTTGSQVSATAKGIVIVKQTHADGTVTVAKKVVR